MLTLCDGQQKRVRWEREVPGILLVTGLRPGSIEKTSETRSWKNLEAVRTKQATDRTITQRFQKILLFLLHTVAPRFRSEQVCYSFCTM